MGFSCLGCLQRTSKKQMIQLGAVPTQLFQPLNLIVNGTANHFMKKHFSVYYANAVEQQLDSGELKILLALLDVDLQLSHRYN